MLRRMQHYLAPPKGDALPHIRWGITIIELAAAQPVLVLQPFVSWSWQHLANLLHLHTPARQAPNHPHKGLVSLHGPPLAAPLASCLASPRWAQW